MRGKDGRAQRGRVGAPQGTERVAAPTPALPRLAKLRFARREREKKARYSAFLRASTLTKNPSVPVRLGVISRPSGLW